MLHTYHWEGKSLGSTGWKFGKDRSKDGSVRGWGTKGPKTYTYAQFELIFELFEKNKSSQGENKGLTHLQTSWPIREEGSREHRLFINRL